MTMRPSTEPPTTTYVQLLERIIADGLAEVRAAYADPAEHHKRDGAIEGFEACRGKTPAEIVACWQASADAALHIMREERQDPGSRTYWRQCYKTLQIEFVLNVLSVGLQQPLLAHLPTANGAKKYAEIVGVASPG